LNEEAIINRSGNVKKKSRKRRGTYFKAVVMTFLVSFDAGDMVG
jgi:hypothetical protein